MKVTLLSNGQCEVRHTNLTLTHTINKDGSRHNDCTIIHDDYVELSHSQDERFKPLFIALHNFKNMTKVI